MTDTLASSHVWDTEDGIGSWTGTPDRMEQLAISIIGDVISAGYSLGFTVLLLFSVPFFILKRKNIPKRPYFILALAGSLLYLGILNLLSSLASLSTMLSLTDYDQPYIWDQLILSSMISIVELSVGGILLYRSSVIRRLLKKLKSDFSR